MEKTEKNQQKNKKIMKALLIVLLLLIIGTASYTYAKYVAGEEATGSADIANWAFQISKAEGEITKNIKLANTVSKTTLVDGKIAPGTSGAFELTLDATGSEVGVDYEVSFANEKNKPDNLTFSYNSKAYNSITDMEPIKGSFDAVGGKIRPIKVQWSWPYTTGNIASEISVQDKEDTLNGTSLLDYSFDVIVTATQSK